MNILHFNKKFLGFPLDEWRKILQNKFESVTVKTEGRGLLVLSDKTIVKCVNNYYCNEDMEAANISLKDPQHCFKTQKLLGISNGVGSLNCKACHLNCLNMRKNRKLHFLITRVTRRKKYFE